MQHAPEISPPLTFFAWSGMNRTPLTIPLQITLSDFKLSGFVILVFSKQKGITVVFRNDPLESLKVSSTFDSIPFVRDFLQKEIEGQLRILFMDELPAIIHRLSLRLWVPEYRAGEEMENQVAGSVSEGPGQDPLASPPQDPVDSLGNALNESEIASLSLDSAVETHSLFSQKNLLRLATLTDSQRTLSLFTPSIQEVVYRAWTSPSDQIDPTASVMSPLSPSLSRTHSQTGSMMSFQDTASTVSAAQSRSPTAVSQSYSSYGLSLGCGRHSKAHARRRKKRVVDLRSRPKTTDDTPSMSDDTSFTDSTGAPSICSAPLPVVNEQSSDDPVTPPMTPNSGMHLPSIPERLNSLSHPLPHRDISTEMLRDRGESSSEPKPNGPRPDDIETTPRSTLRGPPRSEAESSGAQPRKLPATILPFSQEIPTGSSVVDQVLVEKLAGEIARRMRDEKAMPGNSCGTFWDHHGTQEGPPPPAYGH